MTNQNEVLSSSQRIFLVLLSIFLVILLFFFQNGFKANSMLEKLAKNSLSPQDALSNGRPTIFEFYADWCEACKEMAPSMVEAKKNNQDKINVVLINVDNSQWFDLIEKYNVNGIPQLNFFNSNGETRGYSVGVRKNDELNDIFLSLIDNSDMPSFTQSSNLSYLDSDLNSKELIYSNDRILPRPRSHS